MFVHYSSLGIEGLTVMAVSPPGDGGFAQNQRSHNAVVFVGCSPDCQVAGELIANLGNKT